MKTTPAISWVLCTEMGPKLKPRPLIHPFSPIFSRSQKAARRKSGATVPRAYVARRPPPLITLSSVAATVRTAPRMGPEQKPPNPYTRPRV